MANDIWTPPTNWDTGTNFTEAKAEQEVTDNMHVLSLAIDGDSSASTIKQRARSGTLATLLALAAGEVGRQYFCTDLDCWFYDDGTRWQPAWGQHGRNCDAFLEDFPFGGNLWALELSGSGSQSHTTSADSSVQQLVTGAATGNYTKLYTGVNWYPGRWPAWFEMRVKDASASRLQLNMYGGYLGYDTQNGIFFDKNSPGSEDTWRFKIRTLGVDNVNVAVPGTTGSGWHVLRWTAESATVVKAWLGDTLIWTHTGALPGGTFAAIINVTTTENAAKTLQIDRFGLLAKR